MTEVLLDNFTLQGAHCRLRGLKGGLYELCLAHLVEAAVLYDTIRVPAEVLKRNEACKNVAAWLEGVITGVQNFDLPDFHHHLVDRGTVEELRPHIGDAFGSYEADPEAYIIEREGNPPSRSFTPGYMGRDEPELSFAERHAYYTWYCVRLAGAFGLNYAPNPTREVLLKSPQMFDVNGPAMGRDLLQYFQNVRTRYVESIAEVFPSLDDRFQLPLIYNFVKGRSSAPKDILLRTMDLRRSAEATSFRNHCSRLVSALHAGDRSELEATVAEAKALGARWSEAIATSKARKTIKLGLSYVVSAGADVNVPWPIGDPARKPHFVFIHKLMNARHARADA